MTFDHPVCKLAGLETVLEAWREIEPLANGPEYIFLDGAQCVPHIGTWVKHQVDFFKSKKIVFTGSATPLIHTGQESGVGRWHAIRVATLSFYEYLEIKKIEVLGIPKLGNLENLFSFSPSEFHALTEAAFLLIGHFHEYLVRGGFPQTILTENITQAQRLLREDIIEKILRRDMTALFGVRRIMELEQMFIYLCMHDGGIQDMKTICKELGIAKQTVHNFLDLLESTYLIYKLPPHGYGKEVLRGRYKFYLSDPAIAPAILMKGKSILEDAIALSYSVETAVLGHLISHCAMLTGRLSYWRNQKEKEVDITVEMGRKIIPFEVKYHSQTLQMRDVVGLVDFCQQKECSGFIVTKSPQEMGRVRDNEEKQTLMRIPAALLCYLLGRAQFEGKTIL